MCFYDYFTKQDMPKNVELKARVADVDDVVRRARALCDMTANDGTLLVQCDTFFNAAHGRLKLREFMDKNKPSELIFYDRVDALGPKLSDFVKVNLDNDRQTAELKHALSAAIGVRGELRKERLLFLPSPNVRIHVDKVAGLGDFMEIEVCLDESMTAESGEALAKELLNKLGINERDLISGAYIDKIKDPKNPIPLVT